MSSCLYNSQSPGKTIRITSESCGAGGVSVVNGTASSKITIFTHHHHHAATAANSASAAAITGVDPQTTASINIMINNHFNEPLPPPPASKPMADNATLKAEAMTIKRERMPPPTTTTEDSLDDDSGDADSDLSEVAMADSTAATSPKCTASEAADDGRDVSSSGDGNETSAKTTLPTQSTAAAAAAAPVQPPTPAPLHLAVNDEVFVGLPDGRFHLGTIAALGPAGAGRCLVRFPDGRESWSAQQDVQRFSAPDVVAPMCIVCKQVGAGEVAQQCCECGRAYHARCAGVDASGVWFCRRRHRNESVATAAAAAAATSVPVPATNGVEREPADAAAVADVMATAEDRERAAVVAQVKRTCRLPYVVSVGFG